MKYITTHKKIKMNYLISYRTIGECLIHIWYSIVCGGSGGSGSSSRDGCRDGYGSRSGNDST